MRQNSEPSKEIILQVRQLSADEARQAKPLLTALILNAVENGASIGFLPPLSEADAAAYWQSVIDALETPFRVLLAAWAGDTMAGCVQLILEPRANGNHRAEVSKLMVHTAFRRRGIGRKLMQALETEALARGRTTLVLDTRAGDPSQALYTKVGYETCGVIPEYARSADGTLHTTVFMYKLLHLPQP